MGIGIITLSYKPVQATVTPPTILFPVTNSTIAFNRPIVSGTGAPGYLIKLIANGVTYQTTVDSNGNWNVQVGSMLLDNIVYSIVANEVDSSGNSYGASSTSVTIRTPANPITINAQGYARGSVIFTNNQRPVIYGTSTPYQTVIIGLDGVDQTSVVNVDGWGNWSYQPSTSLSAGDHNITGKIVIGTVTTVSNPIKLTIDIVAPAPPVLDASLNNEITSDQRPLISGTAEANSSITLNIDGTDFIGITSADTAGKWSCVPSAALTEGKHVISAKAIDLSNNISEASLGVTLTIDTTAPSPPIVLTPLNNSSTNNKTQTINGTSEANIKINVNIDGIEIGDATKTDVYGNWSYTPTIALNEGTHKINIRAKDAANNLSLYSNTITFTVDTIPPNDPIITTPYNNFVANNERQTISGTSEPNAKIFITIDGISIDNNPVADLAGNWSYTTPNIFSQGTHNLGVKVNDSAGNTSDESKSSFIVDSISPNSPLIIAPLQDSTILPRLVINGSAEANSKVSITVDSKLLTNSVIVDQSGNWTYTYGTDLAKGYHIISIKDIDRANNNSENVVFSIKVVSSFPIIKPLIYTPIKGLITNNSQPLISGHSEMNAKITIIIDGKEGDSVFADESGLWQYYPVTNISNGKHSIGVKSTSVRNKTVGMSGITTITIDTIPPVIPKINIPRNHAVIMAKNLLISGMADPNSKVIILIDNMRGTTLTYKVKASALGSWSLKLSKPLLPGGYIIATQSMDTAGNTSKLSKFTSIKIKNK